MPPLALALAALAAVAGATPKVSVRVESREVHVGDPIRVTIAAVHAAEVAVSLPDPVTLAPFELLDRSHAKAAQPDGQVRDEFVLTLGIYDVGDFEIPAVPLRAVGPGAERRDVATAPIPIAVTSLIGDEADPKPREAADPVPRMVPDWRWAWIAGGAAVLALAALALAWAWRRARHPRAEAARPEDPPDVVALRALRALADSDLLARGGAKEFHLRLSEILRTYVGRRFDVFAVDWTTAETMDWCARAQPEALDVDALGSILALCDLAKFARHRPAEAESREAVARAIALVEATRPRPPAAEAGRAA